MEESWKTLVVAGLPDGAVRKLADGRFDDAPVRDAIAVVARHLSGVSPAQRDALLAWLHACRRHWPSRFATVLGDEGLALIRVLEGSADLNRTLKLRRIAIENLSVLI